MIRNSVKKIGALAAAAILVCAVFAGCGSSAKYDTATPDGTLMTQLDALKTGDFSQLDGYDKEQLEATGVSEAQVKDLMTSFFGQSNYTVDHVETVSDTEANVTISGQAVDMAKFIPVVYTDFLAKATEFATQNADADMTQEEAAKEMIALLIDVAKSKRASAEVKDVSATLNMVKTDNTWEISSDESNANGLVQLLAGSTTEELTEYMQELFGSSFGGSLT